MMDIDNLTYAQLKEIAGIFSGNDSAPKQAHPMLGRRCLVRTYSAGVHYGTVTYIIPGESMECLLENAGRLWKWENGGLSLSAIANNGIKGGRINRTGEIYLTNVIELIVLMPKAEATFEKFIEDKN